MMKIVLLTVLFAGAIADPCCTPMQWEGKYDSFVGTARNVEGIITEVSGMIAYDFTNKMTAMTTDYMTDGQMFMNKTIINYMTKKMYVISGAMPGQTCSITDVEMDMMEACIPPNSKESEPFHYGAGEGNMLMAKAYEFETKYMGQDISGSVSVTNMDCVPITEVVYGQSGDTAMMTSLGYLNVMPGIADPSVFDPPAGCSFTKEKPVTFASRSVLGFPTVHKH